MSRVAHMNESCRTHEWVMSHIWMSHVAHMNESCRTHEWVMSHIWMSHIWISHICKSHVWMSHVTHRTSRVCGASSPLFQIWNGSLLICREMQDTIYVERPIYIHMKKDIYTYTWKGAHNHSRPGIVDCWSVVRCKTLYMKRNAMQDSVWKETRCKTLVYGKRRDARHYIWKETRCKTLYIKRDAMQDTSVWTDVWKRPRRKRDGKRPIIIEWQLVDLPWDERHPIYEDNYIHSHKKRRIRLHWHMERER